MGCFYEVTTNAIFKGHIKFEMYYEDTELTNDQEKNLKLFRLTDRADYEDITESVDILRNIVTGRTDSLSLFSLGYGKGTVPLTAVLNHGPNPVPSEGCIFWFDLPDDTQSALLRIYDVVGRPLFETEIAPDQNRYPSFGRWKPKDVNDHKLGSGFYMYRLKIKRLDGSLNWSGIHKMVIDRSN